MSVARSKQFDRVRVNGQMDSARWERIQILFHEVADLPEPEQRDFLKIACGDDNVLVADVLALVEEDARGVSLLDRDLAHVAHDVLDEAIPASLPFKEFGPYRIKEALGEGGMGVVYLAERIDSGQPGRDQAPPRCMVVTGSPGTLRQRATYTRATQSSIHSAVVRRRHP